MLKSILLALAIVSSPAFANEAIDSTQVEAGLGFSIELGPRGPRFGIHEEHRHNRPYRAECVAENYYRQRFSGFGWDSRQASDNALRNCGWRRDCRIIWCR